MEMRRFPGLIKVVAVVLAIGLSTPACSETLPPLTATDGMVWHWTDAAGACERLEVDVVIDGNSVYKIALPVIRLYRDEIAGNAGKQTAGFKFVEVKHRVYDAETPGMRVSEPGQEIECEIWEAGSENNAVVLGIAFMSHERILLNTVHIASIDEVSESGPAEGVVINTHVIKER